MGLLPATISKISDGTINFDSKSVGDLSEKELQQLRGNQIAMIFQEPMSSLNPSLKCGFQVQEIYYNTRIYLHQRLKGDTFAIRKVKLPDPEIVFDKYPHEICKTTRHDW
jgi:peptide/nickel transport system ATP-binding protein